MGDLRGGLGVGRMREEQGLLLDDVPCMRTALLDSPLEILCKQLNTQLEIEGRVESRDINWKVFKSHSTEITQRVSSCGLNE